MASNPPVRRCAVYTRKSSEEGLEQPFNSLDAQRDAGSAYIHSQAHEGWRVVKTHYDDGGFSGATLERPALQRLLTDIQARKIHIVVVYKVDRLTRALHDFAKLIEIFDGHGVSFASVTQSVNTTTSTGRLMLNVLLSFAQFERELTGERIRDKFAASKKKGWWMGGLPPLGYDVHNRQLVMNEAEAEVVQHIFRRYTVLQSVSALLQDLRRDGYRTKRYQSRRGTISGGREFSRGHLYHLLHNRLYRGEIMHQQKAYPGQHDSIIDADLWDHTQAILHQNRHAFARDERVIAPSLLKELLYDDAGNRMTPSQGRRGPRHYRYYVSQAVLQFREDRAGEVRRLPAESLEQVVTITVLNALKENEDTHDLAIRLAGMEERERHPVLRTILRRVVVSKRKLHITIDPGGGDPHIPSENKDEIAELPDDRLRVLETPFTMNPRGGRTQILVNGLPASGKAEPNPTLVAALVRGTQWRKQLLVGDITSIKALATREGLARRYVMRILRVSFLAPDLMKAILDGNHPPELNLERFRRPIPLDWTTQRQWLSGSPS